jgi:Zn ribbon nucleic-acid-binding protein
MGVKAGKCPKCGQDDWTPDFGEGRTCKECGHHKESEKQE